MGGREGGRKGRYVRVCEGARERGSEGAWEGGGAGTGGCGKEGREG